MNERSFEFPHSPRKIAAFILTSVFFILLALLIISSAKGYKIEIAKTGIFFKKTGTIIITSQPSGAKIYINNKAYTKNTGTNLFTTKINGLLPGKYEIRVEKEGYQSWKKEIQIVEETVSWANYIVLFPKEMKKENFAKSVIHSAQSDDKKKIAYVSKENDTQTINILDTNNLNNSKIRTFEKTSNDVTREVIDLTWVFDNTRLLAKEKVGAETNYVVYNLLNKESEPINISNLFKIPFEKLAWSNSDSRELFALKDKNLYRINIQEKTISASLFEDVIDYDITEDKSLYVVKETKEATTLWKSDLSGNNKQKIIKSLPKSNNYKISYSNNKLLISINGEVKTVYTADKIGDQIELKQISQDVSNGRWSLNGERILLFGEKNLLTYDLKKDKIYQISKGDEIRFASWEENNDRIIANIAGKVKLFEFDGANQIDLGTTNKNSEIYTSQDGKNYFFVSGDIGSQDYLMGYKR